MRYIEENLKEFETCGILKWHQRGYTGKGIKISEIEGADTTVPIFDGKLHDPLNYGTGEGINGHGQKVLDVMHQVAPEADLYILPSGGSFSSDSASGPLIEKSIPYAIREGIDIFGASLGGTDNKQLNEAILDAQKQGVIFCCSAGNEGKRGINPYTQSNVWIGVGALGVNSKEIFLKDYSSRGKDLDFCVFSGLYVYNAKDPTLKTVMQMEGTSFSQPMFSGMLALVQQYFKEKTGRKLTQEEMYQFVKDHTRDFGAMGFDEEYGYGLFVLPDPDTIDVSKYVKGETNMFNDFNQVSSWAQTAVAKLEDLGIAKGDDKGNFNPKTAITREEMAVMIYRTLQNLGKV